MITVSRSPKPVPLRALINGRNFFFCKQIFSTYGWAGRWLVPKAKEKPKLVREKREDALMKSENITTNERTETGHSLDLSLWLYGALRATEGKEAPPTPTTSHH